MKTTLFTISIGSKETRVRIRHDEKDIYGDPLDVQGAIELARERGLKKLYGKNSFWWADNGLPGFGQVCEPLPPKYGNGNNCITGRVLFDVDSDSAWPEPKNQEPKRFDWVVVGDPGTEQEYQVCDFEDFQQACSVAKKIGGDVMKRTENGLTTEF